MLQWLEDDRTQKETVVVGDRKLEEFDELTDQLDEYITSKQIKMAKKLCK